MIQGSQSIPAVGQQTRSDTLSNSNAPMGICAIPIVLCTIVQRLLANAYHKELPRIRQICCGLGYVLIVLAILVCSPFVYILLPVLLCPLLCSSAGRQRFKVIYKHAVVSPFSILWFYHLRCKWQAQEIAFEREKPRPLPLQLRRRLSQAPHSAETQLGALFFTKLPFEIRLQIYKEVLVGDGKHVHVVVHSPTRNPDGVSEAHAHANAMRAGKIRGYQCDHALDAVLSTTPAWHVVDAAEAEIVYARYNLIARTHFSISFPKNRGWGPVTLVKSCKQMYLEAIDLLYSKCCSVRIGSICEELTYSGLQTFSFASLTPPPFFLQSVLPYRLAQIRSIQLCYNSITMSSPCLSGGNDRRAALHAHRMQKCTACNVLTWSKLIKQILKGLRTIEAFIYLGITSTIPALDAPWIERLFEMQYGANGMRELKINVLPDPWMTLTNPPDSFLANAARLDSLLQGMIKKGAEDYSRRKQDIT